MSLQNLGIWDKIEKKVRVTKCCSTSFMEIVNRNAEANVQFNGCPMDASAKMTESSKAEVVCKFPTRHLLPAAQRGGIGQGW